jgi:hypothetical protein
MSPRLYKNNMGQCITLIYTKQVIDKSDIPAGQIYFEEKGYSIFPLDIDAYEMNNIASSFREYPSFNALKENQSSFSDNAKSIIKLIEQLKIDTLLLQHYSEWGDYPTDVYSVIVKDGKIYPNRDHDSIEDILEYFVTIEDSPNLDRYRSYEICEYLFNSQSI